MKNLAIITAVTLMASQVAMAADTKPKAASDQSSPSVVQPVSSEPQSTTANFGDWTLRCTRLNAAANTPKICEVVQSIGVQGQPNPIAQLAFGYESPKGPMKFTSVLPVNVTFVGNVSLATGDTSHVSLNLNWTRCLPEGCFANADVDKGSLASFRSQTEKGKISFKDGAGRDAILPVSFRGLAEALDALDKENAS